jgi:hypothetical protein
VSTFEDEKHRRDNCCAAGLQQHDPNYQPVTTRQDVAHREGNRTGGATLEVAILSRRQSKLPPHYRDAAPLHQGVLALNFSAQSMAEAEAYFG